MDITKLKYLLMIEHEKSISKAADRLYMSQSSLSKIILSIEANIGYKLFERSGGGLVPTEEGKRYLLFAKETVLAEEKVLADMSVIHHDKTMRTIVFGLSPMRTGLSIPNSLINAQFLGDFRTSIVIKNDDRLIAGLMNERIDYALLTIYDSDTLPSAIKHKVLYRERMLIAVRSDDPVCNLSEEIPGSEYRYLAPRHLNGKRVIMYSEGNGLNKICQRFFEAENILPDIRLYEDSSIVAQRFCEAGAGICIVNEEIVKLSPSPNLSYFITSESLELRTVGMLWHKRIEQDPLILHVLNQDIAALTK